MRALLSVILLIISCLPVFSQNRAFSTSTRMSLQTLEEPHSTIKGIIKTSDNEPVPYVNVLLKEAGRGASTDETGFYIIKGIRPGIYTLVISSVGLENQEQPVILGAGES